MITVKDIGRAMLVIGGQHHGSLIGDKIETWPPGFDADEYYYLHLTFYSGGRLFISSVYIHESLDDGARMLALMSIPLSRTLYKHVAQAISLWENS